MNKIGVLSVEIEIGAVSVLIISKTYSVDRNWSRITVDKYPRHIKLIEIGVVST